MKTNKTISGIPAMFIDNPWDYACNSALLSNCISYKNLACEDTIKKLQIRLQKLMHSFVKASVVSKHKHKIEKKSEALLKSSNNIDSKHSIFLGKEATGYRKKQKRVSILKAALSK